MNIESSFTLPSNFYTSSEIFELEKKAIFYRCWQYIGHETQLVNPGDYLTSQICDESILVIKGDDQKLRAFYNTCRHRGHELLTKPAGNIKRNIICPYHSWCYHTDGSLLNANGAEGQPNLDHQKLSLVNVQVENFFGFVFVNLDPKAKKLSEIAKDFGEDLTSRIPFLGQLMKPRENFSFSELAAGWKVVVDNFVECYHCQSAHPTFSTLTDLKDYQLDTFENWSRQMSYKTKSENKAYPFDSQQGFQGMVFWYLWPNTFISVFPGVDEISVISVRPIATDRVRFDGHLLITKNERHIDRALFVNNFLRPEDAGICVSVQKGLKSSSYVQGPYVVNHKFPNLGEKGLYHFHQKVLEHLNPILHEL
ncbi:MAG: aromatic ring-hydroxylating dioxygenase subunit alpha [Bdellovibrionales bacterium]|nr:aromatic ring-hydroxylating dioxygenase subunit alpha [Bdellovibrionales bacterium]